MNHEVYRFAEIFLRLLGITSPTWWPVMVARVTNYVARETTASVDVYDNLANVLGLLWLLTIPLALFCIWWWVRVSWKIRLLYTALAIAILAPITSYTLVYAAITITGGV